MSPAQMKRTWARIIRLNTLCSLWVLHSCTQAAEWATEMRIMLGVRKQKLKATFFRIKNENCKSKATWDSYWCRGLQCMRPPRVARQKRTWKRKFKIYSLWSKLSMFLDTHKVAWEVWQCDQLLAQPVDNQAACQHHVHVEEVSAETDQVCNNLSRIFI